MKEKTRNTYKEMLSDEISHFKEPHSGIAEDYLTRWALRAEELEEEIEELRNRTRKTKTITTMRYEKGNN